MVRRTLILAPVAALALAACGSTSSQNLTSAQQTARTQLIQAHPTWTDHQLQKLCPALYPRNFATDTSKYPLDTKDKSGHKQPTITQADREQAAQAGCNA